MILKYLAAGKICSGFSKRKNENEFLCQNTRGPYVPRKKDRHPPTRGAHERTFTQLSLKNYHFISQIGKSPAISLAPTQEDRGKLKSSSSLADHHFFV